MGDVQVVAKQHLQRVLAGFQRNLGFRAAVPEVHVLCIARDGQAEFRECLAWIPVVMINYERMVDVEIEF